MSTFTITTENRGNARRLVSRLFPAKPRADIWACTLADLYMLLNDAVMTGKVTADDVAAELAAAKPFPAPPVSDEPVRVSARAPVAPATDVATAITAAIQAALAMHAPKAPEVDEGKILGHVEALVSARTKEMIDTVAAAVAAIEKRVPRRIEVAGPDKVVRPVTGKTHEIFETLLAAIAAGVHCWIVGPSGSGKSHVCRQVAEALGRKFYSTGAISTKHELIGYVKPSDGQAVRTPLRDAFEHGGVFAWDDVDASNAAALVAFNEITSNDSFAFPDGMVKRHPDFVAIASSNTWGTGATADYVGRTRIDEATRKRFAFFVMDYDEKLERELAGNDDWTDYVQAVRKAVRELGLKVLVTPRQTYQGVRLLAAGLSMRTVTDATVFAGLDAATRKQISDKLPSKLQKAA